MGKNDYSELGEDIKNVVQDALNSQEFKALNQNIKKTVNSALEEAKRSISEAQRQSREAQGQTQRQVRQNQRRRPVRPVSNPLDDVQKYLKNQVFWRSKGYTDAEIIEEETVPAPIHPNPPGRISGMVMKVFGGIGMGLSVVLAGVLYLGVAPLLGLAAYGVSALTLVVPTFSISTFLFIKGTQLRRRFFRFKEYVKQLNGRAAVAIHELGQKVGKNASFVTKDLRRMIDAGMFPEGRLDEDQDVLLLSEEAQAKYAQEQAEAQRRAAEEAAAAAKARREAEDPDYRNLNELTAQGRRYVGEIRAANEAIPGVVISEKLDRLEMVLKRIFMFIKENPRDIPETRKFMDYYLPTTCKLINAYKELDAQPIQGPNITSAKKEIEDSLDTINSAFERLLDSFYEALSLDISTDISVLNTVLTQEGLKDDGFNHKIGG